MLYMQKRKQLELASSLMEGLACFRCLQLTLLSFMLLYPTWLNINDFCSIQNDHDPSKLVAETPCKLLRYLVGDGSHVDADTPYAEVEVMKMCMPLLSPASGIIHFKMSEGQAMQVNRV